MIEDSDSYGGEDRAAAPVIGVVLMVAITVILAAVIGTFALGMTDELTDVTPQAAFGDLTADAADDRIEVRHRGGDDLAATELTFHVESHTDDATIRFDAADNNETTWRTAERATIATNESGDASLAIAGVAVGDASDTVDLTEGDRIEVTIVHAPSGEIVWNRQFRIRG